MRKVPLSAAKIDADFKALGIRACETVTAANIARVAASREAACPRLRSRFIRPPEGKSLARESFRRRATVPNCSRRDSRQVRRWANALGRGGGNWLHRGTAAGR